MTVLTKTCFQCLLHAKHIPNTIYVFFHLIKSHQIYGVGVIPFVDDEWMY